MVFDKLFNYYLAVFSCVGEPYLKTIANCTVPSRIVRMKYKSLPPIESLSYYERKNLWMYAHETFPGETKIFKKQFIQIVYTIGTLL